MGSADRDRDADVGMTFFEWAQLLTEDAMLAQITPSTKAGPCGPHPIGWA
jgi:hypothetical protein